MRNRLLPRFLGFLCGILVRLWRLTVRIRVVDDPRPALREVGRKYVYAVLHAQQIAFVMLSDDVPIAVMLSASADGDILAGACRARNIVPVRGSSRKKGKEKGGARALDLLVERVKQGTPGLLAVDGPRGPRGVAHWGIVNLARRSGAAILVAGVFPTRRKVLTRSWDRTQIPLPFSTLVGRFRPVIEPDDFDDDAALHAHVTAELTALEADWDPTEARFAEDLREAATAAEQHAPG
jgi:hypothetical protein